MQSIGGLALKQSGPGRETADVDTLRQALAESHATIGESRQSLAVSGEARDFMANELEKKEKELEQLTDEKVVHTIHSALNTSSTTASNCSRG